MVRILSRTPFCVCICTIHEHTHSLSRSLSLSLSLTRSLSLPLPLSVSTYKDIFLDECLEGLAVNVSKNCIQTSSFI